MCEVLLVHIHDQEGARIREHAYHAGTRFDIMVRKSSACGIYEELLGIETSGKHSRIFNGQPVYFSIGIQIIEVEPERNEYRGVDWREHGARIGSRTGI